MDVSTLNILTKKKPGVSVCIYTVKQTKLTAELEVKYTGVFHDRFLIVDDSRTYHTGASLKDAGKKCFAINLMEDKAIVKDNLRRLI